MMKRYLFFIFLILMLSACSKEVELRDLGRSCVKDAECMSDLYCANRKCAHQILNEEIPDENFRICIKRHGIEINKRALPTVKTLSCSLDVSQVENNRMDTLKGIELLRNLEHLEISNMATGALNGVTLPSSLKALVISNNTLENIHFLAQLPKLEILKLNHNKIKNIEVLSRLTRLRVLILNHNYIESIEPLKSLELLEVLHLDKNCIKEEYGFSSMKGKKEKSMLMQRPEVCESKKTWSEYLNYWRGYDE